MSGRAKPLARKADTVARGGLSLQRKCACGGSCRDCGGEKKRLQRAAKAGARAKGLEVPPLVHQVLATPGQPLAPSVRAFMEPRFQHDFSGVRVHTDGRAAESARAVEALAYTVGQHVVFDQGQYQPDTPRGQHLLAHELAHTVQQGEAGGASPRALTFDSPGHDALEREADAAALAAMAATSSGPAPLRPGGRAGPVLSRAARAWQTPAGFKEISITSKLGSHRVLAEDRLLHGERASTATVAFQVDKFYLPRVKERFAAEYQARAGSGQLEAVMGLSERGDTRAALKQSRDGLWSTWLRKVGWPSRDARCWRDAVNGAVAAGAIPHANAAKSLEFRETPNGSMCQADHIVELQLLGSNVADNIIPLEERNNRQTGDLIFDQLESLHDGIKEQHPALENIILSFQGVEVTGPFAPDQCIAIHDQASRLGGTCTSARAESSSAASAYTVHAGVAFASFDPAPVGQRTPLEGAGSSGTNRNARQLVPGILLTVLDRTRQDAADDFFEARLDARKGGRLPDYLAAAINRQPGPVVFRVDSEQKLKHDRPALPALTFTYPYLSEGKLQLAHDDEAGLTGQGTLTPSLPLLKKAIIDIVADFGREELTGSIAVGRDLLTPPPGFRITESSLGIELAPRFLPHGSFGFEVGPRGRPLFRGLMEAMVEEGSGFVARGQVDALLPGAADGIRGQVEYRDHQWSGSLDLQNLRLPLVKDSSLHVGFDDQGVHPSGGVRLALPGGQEAELSVRQDEKTKVWLYQGQGSLVIPGLEPVLLELAYGAQGLEGQARTQVQLRGLSGSLLLGYRKGALFGEGKLSLARGRASGSLQARLAPFGRLVGQGTLTYQLTPALLATAGVKLEEEGSMQLTGALRFTRPLSLFKRFGDDVILFKRSLDIPILGVSLGLTSVGIIARLTGTLSAGYGIGPGTLSDIQLLTRFNPLAANPGLAFTLGAGLDVPMEAHVTLGLRGGVGVSAAVASVTGGITVTGSATLKGGLHSEATLGYQEEHFSLDAKASLMSNLVLQLGLVADILAEAGFYSKSWAWDLVHSQWDPGLRFGLVAPLHYDSRTGLRALSASQLRWIRPELKLDQLMRDLLARQS